MKLLFLIFMIWGPTVLSQNMDIVRSNYLISTKNKSICEEMIKDLSSSKDALKLAYLGAYQTIWANHVFNPLSKLKTFNKGKTNIEKAIKLDPKNVETRILRLSIQTNAPGFLGYKDNIEEDKMFLKEHRTKITNQDLKEIYQKLLK